MPGRSGIKNGTVGKPHIDIRTWNELTRYGVVQTGSGTGGNGGGGGTVAPVQQWGSATIVNGVGFIKITSGFQGAITINPTSYVGGFAITACDNDDVPILEITAIVYGTAGSGSPASFTVSTKSDVGVTFNWLIVG